MPLEPTHLVAALQPAARPLLLGGYALALCTTLLLAWQGHTNKPYWRIAVPQPLLTAALGLLLATLITIIAADANASAIFIRAAVLVIPCFVVHGRRCTPLQVLAAALVALCAALMLYPGHTTITLLAMAALGLVLPGLLAPRPRPCVWCAQPHAQPTPIVGILARLRGLAARLCEPLLRRARTIPNLETILTIVTAAVLAALWMLYCADLHWRPQRPYLLHHWAAYIEPAQALLAGFIPFHEFPLQYGFGPTALTALACTIAGNCWRGFYLASIVMHVAFMAVLLDITFSVCAKSGLPRPVLVLITFITANLWLGYVSHFSILDAPSAGGWRFLPPLAMTALLFGGHQRSAYLLLAATLWYSPEAAAMSLIILGLHQTLRLGFFTAALLTGSTLLVSAVTFTVFIGAIWNQLIDPLAWAEYLIHVPIPKSPAINGLMWPVLGVFGLGLTAFATAERRSAGNAERSLLALATLLAVALYAMGRSVEQVLANLMPFLALVVLAFATTERRRAPAVRVLLAQALAIVLAPLFTVAWPALELDKTTWSIAPTLRQEAEFQAQMRQAVTLAPGAELRLASRLGVPDIVPTARPWPVMSPILISPYHNSDRLGQYLTRAAARQPALYDNQCLLQQTGGAYALQGFVRVFKPQVVHQDDRWTLWSFSRSGLPVCHLIGALPPPK